MGNCCIKRSEIKRSDGRNIGYSLGFQIFKMHFDLHEPAITSCLSGCLCTLGIHYNAILLCISSFTYIAHYR